ncbi:MAG TPA: hypothetical protein IGS17_16205 [Oscillatoriales cyanobacterium M59_W2019_021]|nr:hypothetical protein [Oscillatoriales cyanobacterium M59_W2019_021]
MIKKTSKKQKTHKTGEATPTEVTPTAPEVPAPEPTPQDDAASAIAPTPPTPPKPALVSLKKAGDTPKESLRDRHGEGRFARPFDRHSDDRPRRRSLPAPSKPPAKFDECGQYKAGDPIVLPYSGQTVAFTYFYQGAKPEDWWGVFEGGCVRISSLSSEMKSN